MAARHDIQVRTLQFSIDVVTFCRAIWNGHDITRVLARQLLDAATSVGANMEEADGGQSRADFIAKVAIAKKEAKETVYWLKLIVATDASLGARAAPLLDEARQIAAIVSKIHLNAQVNSNRGPALLAPMSVLTSSLMLLG